MTFTESFQNFFTAIGAIWGIVPVPLQVLFTAFFLSVVGFAIFRFIRS